MKRSLSVRGDFLEDLSWDEAEARFRAGRLVLVPIGAAAKEHGLHLPLKTDFVIARELARRVAMALPVVVAPVLSLGYYPAFTNYAGSQHVSAATFIAMVREVLEGFVRQGVRQLAILNTGVSTEPPLQIAVRQILEAHGVSVAIANLHQLGRAADAQFERRDGGHADERETSLLLALEAGLVRLERAEAAPATTRQGSLLQRPVELSTAPSARHFSPSGATGDPSRATAAKGQALLEAILKDLLQALQTEFPDAIAHQNV